MILTTWKVKYTKGKSILIILYTFALVLKTELKSLLWDVFIINSVEQLQTLPKTQSEIDISPFLKTQKPSILYSIIFRGFLCYNRVEDRGTYGNNNRSCSV
jgi:hypothetical protein